VLTFVPTAKSSKLIVVVVAAPETPGEATAKVAASVLTTTARAKTDLSRAVFLAIVKTVHFPAQRAYRLKLWAILTGSSPPSMRHPS
jgi:hypothetical protein